MIPASLQGNVESSNIKLGKWRWFAAPADTYIDEMVRFNTTYPPAPFIDFGCTDTEAALSFTKTLLRYTNGVPAVLKNVKVTALDFSVTPILDQFSGSNLAKAIMGNLYAIKEFLASPAIVVAAAVPGGNVLQMTSVTGYVIG